MKNDGWLCFFKHIYAILESSQGLGSEKLTSLGTSHQMPTSMTLSLQNKVYLATFARNPEIALAPMPF